MTEYKTTQTTMLTVENDSNDLSKVEITVMIDGRPERTYILIPYDKLLDMVNDL